MASGTIGDFSDDLNWRGGCRWSENSKVYTRRHKKAQKTCKNDDNATTTTSAAPTTSTNLTSTRTEVSSATLGTTTAASEDTKNDGAASPPPTPPGNIARTTTPQRTEGGNIVEESLEAVVTKDVDSDLRLEEDSAHQKQSLSRGSPEKDADSSVLQQQLQLSTAEDYHSTQNRVQEGSGIQTVEDLPLPDSNETQKLGVSSENDLPNGRNVTSAQPSETQNDGEVMPGSPQVPEGNAPVKINGVVKPLVISSVDDKIRFNLCKATSKNEIKELRKKLECELDQVRKVVKQLQAKELQLGSYNTQISNSNLSNSNTFISSEGAANIGGYGHPQPQPARSDVVDRRVLLRVNTDVGAMGHQETRPMVLTRVNSDMGAVRNVEPRPYSRQLSVAVMENNHKANEFVEKEKRTPKANQYYRNSEFLLGKDRLPPESNKRLKTNNGRKHSGETEHAFGFGGFDKSRNQVFRSCSSLLQRLMKHKHGWVFNEPVDAKALGLVDYHDIIKHPMDLGTIKTRLSQNWYKSPREFAEDVRLVFRNAMTYNPKGQDVHVMAEQLLQIFEERWAIIETEYNSYWKYQMYQDGGVPTPTSRKAPPQSLFAPNPSPVPGFIPVAVHAPAYAAAPQQMRTYDRPEPIKTSLAFDPKIQRPHGGRTPVPKKPKAKDPNKRDMTYDEKQRLSTNLQGLPTEKLDAIVQIIKKRNTAVSQHDDEIEVDIDSVDAETLWELDRFVTNYKKSLSKNKRKAELALQARTAANQNVPLENPTPAGEVQIESGAAFEKSTARTADGEKQAYNGSRSSSSSSSSSDSGSSSSDSDSDSSSADGSDAGHSPRT